MAGGQDSGKAVVFALAGNSFLTIIKLIAYLLSGSGAMLAETVHSAADTGNQALLLVGIRKSQLGPDQHFHFGYGKDRYLWALISAAGIFFIGCGVSVTHGVHALLAPHEVHDGVSLLVVGVLAISLVVDGVVLYAALKELNTKRKGRSWVTFLRTAEDTSTVAVLFEDGAACLGVILAAIGIVLAQAFGIHWADPVAAILIGLLLGAVAIFLGAQNRAYLLDRAVSHDVQGRVLELIRSSSRSVRSILSVKTRVIGADRFAFNADIEFDGAVLSERILARVDVKAAFAGLKSPEDLDRLLDEHARIVVDELGEEVNRIEAEVQKQVPGAHFLRLETD